MGWRDNITVDPRILVGKPIVKGTRIAVEMVVDLLAAACLAYASELLHSEKVYPIEIA